MSLYAMADLHLSSDRSKSMDIFGPRWQNHMERIKKNWTALIDEDDTVIIPGDISWSLKLEESLDDFRFLEALPGQKLIGKGNHDFWWSTQSKMKAFWEKNNFKTIRILYNNAYRFDNCIVSGTRGWFMEEGQQHTVGTADYTRIVNREVIRLKLSLDEAKKLQDESETRLPIVVFLHFPPIWNDFVCREFVDLFHEYGVQSCYFGHVHGAYTVPPSRIFEGIQFVFCAADYLNFTPIPVYVKQICE